MKKEQRDKRQQATSTVFFDIDIPIARPLSIFNQPSPSAPPHNETNNQDPLASLRGYLEEEYQTGGYAKTLIETLGGSKVIFLIDDSASMTSLSSAQGSSAFLDEFKHKTNSYLRRWEYIKDILHEMIRMLSFVQPDKVVFKLLNGINDHSMEISGNKNPIQFITEADNILRKIFSKGPVGPTPTYASLSACFQENRQSQVKQTVLFFTDGEPNDGVQPVIELVKNRRDPRRNPIGFMNCGNKYNTEWLRKLDEEADGIWVVEEFPEHIKRVKEHHGKKLEVSRISWQMGMLCGEDSTFDKIDKHSIWPFSPAELSKVQGHSLRRNEWSEYVKHHPSCKKVRWGAIVLCAFVEGITFMNKDNMLGYLGVNIVLPTLLIFCTFTPHILPAILKNTIYTETSSGPSPSL